MKRAFFGLLGDPQPAAGASERRLLEIWERVLGVEGIGVEDDYFSLGGDSFLAVALLGEIERVFGQSPPMTILLDCPNIRLLARRLDGSADSPSDQGPTAAPQLAVERPLVAIRAEGDRPPLIFVHAAKGNILFAAEFLPHLAPDQPLYALQARGLEPGEKPHHRFETMAADYVAAIRRMQPHGPYHLAGLCIGCLTALEIARILRAAGEEVPVLALVDPDDHPSVVPWLHWRDPDALQARMSRPLLRALRALRRQWRNVAFDAERGRLLPALTVEEARRQAAIRKGFIAAVAVYRPRPYDGPLTLYTSAERRATLGNPARGWPAFAPRTRLVEFGRWHHDLLSEHRARLGREIQALMDGAGGASSP
jgi:thioesterase domain-containing protein